MNVVVVYVSVAVDAVDAVDAVEGGISKQI